MQIGDIANLLTKPKRQTDGSFLAICPCHDDKKQSLHVSESGGKILLKCFAGCDTETICQSLKIELSDLFTEEEQPSRKIVAEYCYQDEEGNELYQVVRFDPKGFQQRHRNGGGEYVYKMDGVRRVLYHLPEVLASKQTVYIVEGEKDADNLRKFGLVATTSPGGAGAWKSEYANYLNDKRVILIPDKDSAGYSYARSVSESLKKKPTCIILPGPAKDISDWLQYGKIESLSELEQGLDVLIRPPFLFENKTSKYLFKWDEIQAEVSRIRSKNGTISCQVIFSRNEWKLRTKLNLESSRTRSELAKDLTTRQKDIDWKKILEDLSDKTLEEFEKGEPVINVTSMDNVEELQYLIHPIIPLGKPTVLFGDPGSGKSQLSVVFLILTGLPWHDNPLHLGVKPNSKHIGLILDWEADEFDVRRQLKLLTQGMDLGYTELKYRRCALPLADDLESIRTHIEDTKADYIIIDSVSLAAGGDLNHMDCATNYFRALRQLNITSISLAHTSKDRENKSKTILGSVLFEAGARSVWEVRGQEDDDCLDIAMFHRKSNDTKKSPPVGFRISYTDKGNLISWHDPTSVAEFVERMNTSQRVIELLKERPYDDREIVETLEITPGNWRVTKSRLRSKNIITEINGCNALVTRFS